MTSHARFAPSAAGEWVNCAHSLTLPHESLIDRGDTDESIEGTQAHAVLAALLTCTEIPAYATQEMIKGAIPLAELIGRTVGVRPGLYVESRVDAPSIHPECWGTPDAYFICHDTRRVYLWDYKFGHGFVESVKNWQLVCYVQGIIDTHNVPDDYAVEACIAQPRCFHYHGDSIRRWVTTVAEVQHLASVASSASENADKRSTVATTGPHCKYCKRRANCEALKAVTRNIIDISVQANPTNPTSTEVGEELSTLADALERLKARITGLEALAMHQLRSGKSVPGWVVTHSKPHEKWTLGDADMVAMFGAHVQAKKPITPSQARKAGLDPAIVAEYSYRPPGQPGLVRLTEGEVTRNLTHRTNPT